MTRNRICIVRETLLGTWQERLLQKLGKDFKVQQTNTTFSVMKRCKVFLWTRTPETGWVEVAYVAIKDVESLHKALNPVLTAHTKEDLERLQTKLDKEPVADQWRMEVQPDPTVPPKK